MKDITVRRANEQDAPAIMELLEQVLKVHHDIRPDLFAREGTKYTQAELVDIILNDERPVFVAVDGSGEVLGHCFTVVEERGGGSFVPHKTLYIDDLSVHEKSRRLGVGRMLCEYAVEYAKQNGFHNVTLHVWSGNDNAEAFYGGMGFATYMKAMEKIIS